MPMKPSRPRDTISTWARVRVCGWWEVRVGERACRTRRRALLLLHAALLAPLPSPANTYAASSNHTRTSQ